MINTRYIFAAAGMAALTLSAPVLADNRNHGSWQNSGRGGERQGWNSRHDTGRHYGNRDYDNRDDRRDERRAYANGYRDGARQPSYGYVYGNRQPAYGNAYNRPPVYYGGSGYGQPVYRGANYWVGSNGRINCRRNDGSTGVIVGAVAGGTLGNILAQNGDKAIGSIIGGTLGAILGKELDKGNGTCR